MHVIRTHPPALMRLVLGAAAVIGLAVGGWNLPLRDHALAPILIEPHQLQHVYAELPGELQEISVSVGEYVHQGDAIAHLESIEVRQRLISLAGEQRKRQADLAMARATSNPDLRELVTTEIETVDYQIQAQRQRLRRLLITAPCSGIVMSAPESSSSVTTAKLRFTGSEIHALDVRNRRAFIPRRTHLCSIAPDDRWQAIAWVDQDQCQFLSLNQPVEVMLDAFPGRRIAGRIESISRSQDLEVPASLSQKYGGELLTQTSAHGEVPSSATYRVAILLSPRPGRLCLGMKGSVRYVRTEQSVGDWITHAAYRFFIAL